MKIEIRPDGSATIDTGGGEDKSPMIITVSGPDQTADKTYAEIIDAMNAGRVVLLVYDTGNDPGRHFCYASSYWFDGGHPHITFGSPYDKSLSKATHSLTASMEDYPYFFGPV